RSGAHGRRAVAYDRLGRARRCGSSGGLPAVIGCAGEGGPMARKAVSIKEVAVHAGVSVGTVSNVLNRPDSVAEPTRLAVVAAIDELGFVRNGSASRLRSTRSHVVGLVVHDIGNPFFAE